MRRRTTLALAGVMLASSLAAHADVDVPSSGNGELTLFVRDVSDSTRVYARGLGINLDDVMTQAQIQSVGPPPQAGVPVTFSYPLPAIEHDQNLTDFLSGASEGYVWTIMGGDSDGGGFGARRYVTTTQVGFSAANPSQVRTAFLVSRYGFLESMLQSVNVSLPDSEGSSTPTGGEWGSPFGFEGAVDWLGAGPNNVNTVGGPAANLYLLASGVITTTVAPVYQLGSVQMLANGDLVPAPLPAGAWLLASAIAGLAGASRRRRVGGPLGWSVSS